jgi:hypothetical protein
MPFDRKYISPNHRLTEGRLTDSLFTEKTHLAEIKIYQKVVDPKYMENCHLTEILT